MAQTAQESDSIRKIPTACDTETRENFPGGNKKKGMMQEYEGDEEFVLECSIYHAEDIDSPPSRYPNVTARNYCAILWVEPGREVMTSIVGGVPDPVWRESFEIGLVEPWNCRFLNVEIVRLNSYNTDPGTSMGVVIVGRAQIALPGEISIKTTGRFGLLKLQDMEVKGEGHIVLSMNLEKY